MLFLSLLKNRKKSQKWIQIVFECQNTQFKQYSLTKQFSKMYWFKNMFTVLLRHQLDMFVSFILWCILFLKLDIFEKYSFSVFHTVVFTVRLIYSGSYLSVSFQKESWEYGRVRTSRREWVSQKCSLLVLLLTVVECFMHSEWLRSQSRTGQPVILQV